MVKKKLENIKNIEDIKNALGDMVRFSELQYFRYKPYIAFIKIESKNCGMCPLPTTEKRGEVILIDPYKLSGTQAVSLAEDEEANLSIVHSKQITKNKYETLFYVMLHEIGHLLYNIESKNKKEILGVNLKVKRSTYKIDFNDKSFHFQFDKKKKNINFNTWNRKNKSTIYSHIQTELWALRQFKKHRKEIQRIIKYWKPCLFEGKNPFGKSVIIGI
jgi:hypothetical protein